MKSKSTADRTICGNVYLVQTNIFNKNYKKNKNKLKKFEVLNVFFFDNSFISQLTSVNVQKWPISLGVFINYLFRTGRISHSPFTGNSYKRIPLMVFSVLRSKAGTPCRSLGYTLARHLCRPGARLCAETTVARRSARANWKVVAQTATGALKTGWRDETTSVRGKNGRAALILKRFSKCPCYNDAYRKPFLDQGWVFATIVRRPVRFGGINWFLSFVMNRRYCRRTTNILVSLKTVQVFRTGVRWPMRLSVPFESIPAVEREDAGRSFKSIERRRWFRGPKTRFRVQTVVPPKCLGTTSRLWKRGYRSAYLYGLVVVFEKSRTSENADLPYSVESINSLVSLFVMTARKE